MNVILAVQHQIDSPWYAVGFGAVFVGMWVLVSFLISRCGWSAFAARYPARERPAGRVFNAPSVRFPILFGGYNNVVRVVFAEEGIYFSVMFLFRAFHPPFLVPWESLRGVEMERHLFSTRYKLTIEDPAGNITVLLPERAGEELRQVGSKVPLPGLEA